MELKELRAKRAELIREVQSHNDKDGEAYASAGGIDKHKELMAKVKDFDERIEAKAEAAKLAGQVAERADRKNVSFDEEQRDTNTVCADFRAYVLGRPQLMSERGREHYAKPYNLHRDGERIISDYGGPENREPIQAAVGDRNNAADTTASATSSGVAIPIEVGSRITMRMKDYSALRRAATVQTVQTGRSQVRVTLDTTDQEGEIVVPGTNVGDEDFNLGSRAIQTQVFSSKRAQFELDWIEDMALEDFTNTITSVLAVRLARLEGKIMTLKSGAALNNGIMDDAPVGVTLPAGKTTVFDLGHLNDLRHSIDPAYRSDTTRAEGNAAGQTGQDNGMRMATCSYMMSDESLKNIDGAKDSEGRPLILPSFRTGGELGYMGNRIFLNQYMEAPAAGKKTVLFGQLSNFIIREVGQLQFHVLRDSPEIRNYTIGFVAFHRCGYRLIDVGDSVKVLRQAAS